MKKIIILLISISLMLTGCIITDPEDTPTNKPDNETSTATTQTPEPTQEPEEEDVSVTAVELLDAYDKNEVKADNLYKDKTLEVTGDIKSIGKDMFDKVFITLGDKEDIFALISVQCYFKDDAEIDKVAELSEGDTVTVIGTCEGSTLNITLKNCTLK